MGWFIFAFFQWVLSVFQKGGGKGLDFLMKMGDGNNLKVYLF